jgi:tripartite-type tricarboxylate transporter receptor subunit TctC
LPLLQAGRLKLIAIGAPARAAYLPDVPTLAEAGGPPMTVGAWLAIVAPRGTPPAVVAKINADIDKVLREPDVIAQLKTFGFEGTPQTPEQFADEVRADMKRFAELVQRTGATAD